MRRLRPCVLALLLVAGCAPVVSVTPAGKLTAPPRPANCAIEFFRSKVPERPYDELAGLHSERGTSAGAVQDAMRAKACELGADAVIVTRDYVPGSKNVAAVMTGTAIKYRAGAAAPAGQ
jgi:hypothetical protein